MRNKKKSNQLLKYNLKVVKIVKRVLVVKILDKVLSLKMKN